jgi:hypothetical protein
MEAMSSQLARFVDAVAEAVALHGEDEQRWFADWSADFDEAQRDGDHEAATLLVDTLVAFNAWLSGQAGGASHGRARAVAEFPARHDAEGRRP